MEIDNIVQHYSTQQSYHIPPAHPIIIVVIITWPTEKPSQKNNYDITVFRVTDWLKWLNLFKISSLMSQFSTNKRT